jgi:hypothetical protein
MTNRDTMRQLMQESYRWILQMRSSHVLVAKRISTPDRESLQPYFTSNALDRARVAVVDHIDNPPFYPQFQGSGVRGLIDFHNMDGITFVDCILLSKSISGEKDGRLSILFHELVHVVQYWLLGPRRFVEHYLTGWYKGGGDYFKIPLEKQAYDLQRRFERGEQFTVERKLGVIF